MLGAIIGDIVGSRFEFNPTNDYNFKLFTDECSFTDDTICTVAIADALLHDKDYGESLHDWCRRYPNPKGGYGGRFREWVMSDNPKPYNSFGNGSAMRVSPVAWRFQNAFGMVPEAEKTAACTHNHPEGIKGAQTVALAIHCGDEIRRLSDKIDRETILKGFERVLEFSGYNINIRRANVLNKFDETCQGTVPVALWIITESTGFEDAIRKAVSLGADADTLGAIVGSIAEAIWGVPTDMALQAMHYLPSEMKSVVLRFYMNYCREIFPLEGYGDEGAAQDLLAEEDAEEENEEKAQIHAIMRWKLGLGNFNGVIEGGDGLPPKKQKATADSWKTMAMPDDENDISHVDARIEISLEQMEILRKGHIPEVQEDHWFMYCTDDCIRYYRSWTGMCAFEGFYHEENHRFIIDKVNMNRGLCEFGVNGDKAGLALFVYLIAAETGCRAEEAWHEYILAWDYLDRKYSKKVKPEPKVADPWFTGTHGKICEGCIYKDGIRRMGDSLSNEIMGCGRCCRDTFKKNYEAGTCKFRKTDLFVPSEFELEAKAATLRRIKEKEAKQNAEKKAFEKTIRAYVLLKKTYAAGTAFVKDKKALMSLKRFSEINIVRECDNKHDENAVSLYFKGSHIGYIPRKENREIAAMLEAGLNEKMVTYVTELKGSSDNISFEFSVFLKPEPFRRNDETENNETSNCFKQNVVKVQTKPRKCPHCGGNVYRILYGEPICCEEEYFERFGEHVIFGGCCVTDNDPEWECIDCHTRFKKIPFVSFKKSHDAALALLDKDDDYWDDVKYICFWKGLRVYTPTSSKMDDGRCTGLPQAILVNSEGKAWWHNEPLFDIMHELGL